MDAPPQMSSYLQTAYSAGNINIASGPNGATETLALSATSEAERRSHDAILFRLACEKRGRSLAVATTEGAVKAELRKRGEPVCLFGENKGDIRERLRFVLGRELVLQERNQGSANNDINMNDSDDDEVAHTQRIELTYTPALPSLIAFRKKVLSHASEKTAARLSSELARRSGDDLNYNKLQIKLDARGDILHKWARNTAALEGSVFGSDRPLTSICFSPKGELLAASGWDGIVKVYDGGNDNKQLCSVKGHTDRVTCLRFGGGLDGNLLASAGIDMTGRVFGRKGGDSGGANDWGMEADGEEGGALNASNASNASNIYEEKAVLKGHAKRACQVAWHPLGTHLVTTSYDNSWRLWDAETSGEVLLQDGHFNECYGVAIHPDGALISTSDFGGVVAVWDLRSSKRISTFQGHSKRVLALAWNANGYHLASAGDDGLVKVWDLRKRKQHRSVPAHKSLITSMEFDESGEVLATCSFDATVKLWSARDYGLLRTLEGHQGKVMDVTFGGGGDGGTPTIATTGFDKTFKIWR